MEVDKNVEDGNRGDALMQVENAANAGDDSQGNDNKSGDQYCQAKGKDSEGSDDVADLALDQDTAKR